MAPKDAAELFVQRQRRSGPLSSGRTANKLGEIPLSAGEIEYLTRQDEAARRRQRLLHVRQQEKRAAQLVTQRYRENLRRLQAQKMKLAQRDHVANKEMLLSTLHEKYQLSLQGMGAAQRSAREKLIELMEQAQVEQHKWALNRRGEKLRYEDAVDAVRDDEAMRLARRREIEKNLERLKIMSERQRSVASTRAKRELELQLKLKRAQEDAERHRREHAEMEEFSFPRKTPKDVTAYQFTRTHCVAVVPTPAPGEPGSTRATVNAGGSSRQQNEVKVIRHNPNRSKEASAAELAEQYRREMEKKMEEDWRLREENERLANTRGQEAHHVLESRREGESAIQWLLTQHQIERGFTENGAHTNSEKAPNHDRVDLHSESGTDVFAQLFGLEEDAENRSEMIHGGSIRVLARRCDSSDDSWGGSSDDGSCIRSGIRSITSVEGDNMGDLSFLDAFHKAASQLPKSIPTTTTSERVHQRSPSHSTPLRGDSYPSSSSHSKASIRGDEFEFKNTPHAQEEEGYSSSACGDVAVGDHPIAMEGDAIVESREMLRRSPSLPFKNDDSSSPSFHRDSVSGDDSLMGENVDWRDRFEKQTDKGSPSMSWRSSIRPRHNNRFDRELRTSPANDETTSGRGIRPNADSPPRSDVPKGTYDGDNLPAESVGSTPSEIMVQSWMQPTASVGEPRRLSNASSSDSSFSQPRELSEEFSSDVPERWAIRSAGEDSEVPHLRQSTGRGYDDDDDSIRVPSLSIDKVESEATRPDAQAEASDMQSLLAPPHSADEQNPQMSHDGDEVDKTNHLPEIEPSSEYGASRLAPDADDTPSKSAERGGMNTRHRLRNASQSAESNRDVQTQSLPIQVDMGSRSSVYSDREEELLTGSIVQYSLPLSDSFSSTGDSIFDHNADFEALANKLIPIFPALRRMSSASSTSVEPQTRENAADVSSSVARGETSILLQGLDPQIPSTSDDEEGSRESPHKRKDTQLSSSLQDHGANSDNQKQQTLRERQRSGTHFAQGALDDLSFLSDSSSDMSAYIYLTRMRELSARRGHTRGSGNPTQHNVSESVSESSSASDSLPNHDRPSRLRPRRAKQRESFGSSSSSSSLDARFHYLMSMTAAAGKAFPLHLNLPAPSFQPPDMSTPPHPIELDQSTSESNEEQHDDRLRSSSSHSSGTPAFMTPNAEGSATYNRGANIQQSSLNDAESDAQFSSSSSLSTSFTSAHNTGQFATRNASVLPHQHPIAKLDERLAKLPVAPFGNLDMSNPPPPLVWGGSDAASSIWEQERQGTSDDDDQPNTKPAHTFQTKGEGEANQNESNPLSKPSTGGDISVKARNGDALFVPLDEGERSHGTTVGNDDITQPVSLAEAFQQRHPNFRSRSQTTKELIELRREHLEERRAITEGEKKTHPSTAGSKVTSRLSDSPAHRRVKSNPPQQQSKPPQEAALPKPELLDRLASGERAQISAQERRERTRRLYNQLPEVQERKRQEDVLERRRQRLEEMREREKTRRQQQRQRREQAQASKAN